MSDISVFSPLWGEWYIKELIGKGTFGAVYRAEKTEYGNTYTSAVKHISIPNDNVNAESLISEGIVSDEKSVIAYYDSVRDKMISEINFCYALRGNTNIVSYEDHCIIPKTDGAGYDIFIRMEHLTALPKYMRENSFGERDIAKLGADICSALEVLDKHSIIHRDIKPANIFVNSVGVYKLGDFGESKVLSNTNMGMTVRGTYTYMSPEISMGRNADITADIYSLGIVMYRLLNGNKAPFVPTDVPSVDAQTVENANIRRFRGEKFPLPMYCQSRQFAAIIMKACEYSPADRWQKPVEMRKALEALMEASDKGAANRTGEVQEPSASAATRTVPAQNADNSGFPQPQPQEPSGNKLKSRLRIIIPVFAALLIAAGVITVLALSKPPQKGDNNGDGRTATSDGGSVPAISERVSEQNFYPGADDSSLPDESSEENGGRSIPDESTDESSPSQSGASENSPDESGSDESSAGQSSAEEPSDDKEAKVVSLTILSMPSKLTYAIGEAFEPDGFRIEAAYDDGTKKEINASECTFGTFDSSSAGTKSVTAGYGGKETVIELTVTEVRSDNAGGECGTGVRYTLDDSGLLTISGRGAVDDFTLGYVILENGSVGVKCSAPWTDMAGVIERVVVEEGVTRLGSYSFYDCPNLESVKLPDSLKTLGESSFRGCVSLVRFDLPAGLADIGDETFINCSSMSAFTADIKNPYFSAQDGLLYSKDKTELIKCPEAKTGQAELPYGLKTIDNWAFDSCEGLTSVTVPSSVTTIGGYAFSGCTGISRLSVGNSVSIMGSSVFRYWNDSQTIEFVGLTSTPASWTRDWNSECSANILWDGAFG